MAFTLLFIISAGLLFGFLLVRTIQIHMNQAAWERKDYPWYSRGVVNVQRWAQTEGRRKVKLFFLHIIEALARLYRGFFQLFKRRVKQPLRKAILPKEKHEPGNESTFLKDIIEHKNEIAAGVSSTAVDTEAHTPETTTPESVQKEHYDNQFNTREE
jgi:type II secretory pathway component PulM